MQPSRSSPGAASSVDVNVGLDEAERDEPGKTGPAFRLDHEVGHRGRDGVDDRGPHLARVPVAARGDGADPQQRYHQATSFSLPVATSNTKPRTSSLWEMNGLAWMRALDCRTSSSTSVKASTAHGGRSPVSS